MSTEIPVTLRSFDAERAALQSFGTYIGAEEIDTGIFRGYYRQMQLGIFSGKNKGNDNE
jgi:hypothetical protein